MKKVILLALLMPFQAFGQIMENFESGTLERWVQSTDNRWKAEIVSGMSGLYSLHHSFDNIDAGTDCVGIPVANLHPSQGVTKWSFLIRHGYDPSSSNNWSVFLICDSDPAAMASTVNKKGFAIGVNLVGYDDTLRLWKIDGSDMKPVVTCHVNWQTNIGINEATRIEVIRSEEGGWTVSVFRMEGDIICVDSGTDASLFGIVWFGVCYKYSSTRDRLLWIDNISIDGNFYDDNDPPAVTACKESGRNSVIIVLNEEPSDDFFAPGNIILNSGDNQTVSIVETMALTYKIEFSCELKNKSLNNLVINKICDKSGNCTGVLDFTFTPVWAEQGDVIISEIMADPIPVVSLPAKEYIEIFNQSSFPLNLSNWKLSADDQESIFPETIIQPLSARVICSVQDTALFSGFGDVTGLKQLPSLTDEGRVLILYDNSGALIHGVEYLSDWYKDELKSGGGWSLELIDAKFPFYYDGNWKASRSKKGGTPGSPNSVSQSNPDISFIGVTNVFPEDSIHISVRFSEPLFNLDRGINNIKLGGMGIVDIFPTDLLFCEFTFTASAPIRGQTVYELEISEDIRDFAGNMMQKRIFNFGMPEVAQQGDILFNELLFNPFPGEPDYAELFNCSEKVIDASRLQIVSLNDASGDTSLHSLVSEQRRCIMPGSYFAFTTDIEKITRRFFSSDAEHLFETEAFPSMPDNAGHLILYNRELDKIDEVIYNEKMHYSLLSGYEGISLEKTGIKNRSEEAGSWHSASESAGWGTPGAPNSVFIELPPVSDIVSFSSSKITPDNDGYEDLLTVSLSLTGNGNVVSAMIFDETGSYVDKLAENMLAGPGTTLVWDGRAADGSLVNPGIYIVFITLFDESGKTGRWKKACAVLTH